MDNLLAHMRRSLVWTAAQQWGVQAIRLAVLMVLARMVSSAAFGVFAFASTAVGVVHLICNQGMTAAIVQRPQLDDRHTGAALVSTVASGLLMAVALVASARWFGHLLANSAVVPLLRVLAWCLPLYALAAIPNSLWRRNLAFKRIAVVATASQMLASIVAIALAVKGFGIWSLVARMLGEARIQVLLTSWAIPWKLLFRASYRGYVSGYRDMWRVAYPSAAINLMALGRNRFDELLIGSALGAEVLGYYALARRQIDGVYSLAPAVIANALTPVLSRIQSDAVRAKAVMLRGIGLLGALALPVFVGMGASASTWVPLLLGARWLPSVPVIQGLALMAVTRAIVGFGLSALFAIGHSGKRFLIELAGTGLCLLITIAALPFGIQTIAYACAVGMVLFIPFELIWLSRWLDVSLREQMRALTGPILGGVLLLIIIAGLQNEPWRPINPILRLTLTAIAAAIILLVGYRRIEPVS
jgi:O-antigen/teichoic acid export membrane protein